MIWFGRVGYNDNKVDSYPTCMRVQMMRKRKMPNQQWWTRLILVFDVTRWIRNWFCMTTYKLIQRLTIQYHTALTSTLRQVPLESSSRSTHQFRSVFGPISGARYMVYWFNTYFGGSIHDSAGQYQKSIGPVHACIGPLQMCIGPLQMCIGTIHKCTGPIHDNFT